MPYEVPPPREPHPSWEDIAIEAVTRRDSTAPLVRLLQKFWWKASIAFALDHILHELIARASHWR